MDEKSSAIGSRFSRSVEDDLNEIRELGRYRTTRSVQGRPGPRALINGREVLMFAGSNYLDLAGDDRVIAGARTAVDEYGAASGGSRLINGNLRLHEELEADLAAFAQQETALLFSTGYMANLGVITALAGPEDVIVSDELNHASIIDACRLSRAETRVFAHNNPHDLRRVTSTLVGFRRRLLVLDGVFSMDGDIASLSEIVPIAREHEMTVVMDDTHGFGVLGPNGRGTAELEGTDVDVTVGSLSKALGSFGGYAVCSNAVRELLINVSWSFIFTCGLLPAAVGAARSALKIIIAEPRRRVRVLERAAQLRNGLSEFGFDIGASRTHIVPVILGENARVMDLCEKALDRGIYAQGIRFPSVPLGAERLRITPICSHSPEDVSQAVTVLSELSLETAI